MQKFNASNRFLLAFIVVLSLSFLGVISLSSASLTSFSNVQIDIQTSNIQSGYFIVSAFNMTGYQEASVQTYYPAASFELPAAQYIFTVTANNQTYSIYPVPLALGASSSSGESSPSTPSLPIYVAPATEYGYVVQQISNAATIKIATKNVSSFPTDTLTIQVLYANGTAAANASISASTIGSSYYWGYEPNVITWTTTGPDGYATLVTPIAPEQIDAWSWLPLNFNNTGAPQVTIAGEPVNATGSIKQAYIGLAGSTVLIPPQTTTTITMHTEQQNYWVTPYATTPGTGSTSSTPSQSSTAGPGAIPSSVYAKQQGNPAIQASQTPTPPPSSTTKEDNTLLLLIIAALLIAAIVVAALIIVTKNKRKNKI